MAEEKVTKREHEKIAAAVVKQMLQLATAGFGLVAALAWNEAIKATINEYIKPYIGGDSGIISLVIYAVIVTVLAVVITLQLARLSRKFEKEATD